MRICCAAALAAWLAASSAVAQIPDAQVLLEGLGETAGIESQADGLLKRMSSYLGGLQQFSVETESAMDVVLKTGQKVQMCAAGDVSVRRPDRLRVDRKGQLADVAMYYDGKAITVYGRRHNLYASAPAPTTLDAALDEARDKYGLTAPAADLLYADVYAGLIRQANRGFVVGHNEIAGVMCTHLAFRNESVDWQVWIADGDRPLPMRYVLTGPAGQGAPEFGVTMRNWNVSPNLRDADFEFAPPDGAQKIEFLNLDKLQSPEGGK